MAFEEGEFRDQQKVNRSDAAREIQNGLRVLRQAALKAEAVTGDPAWDSYLGIIANQVEEAEKQRGVVQGALANPNIVDPNAVAQLRTALIRIDEQLRTLQWAVSLPAIIKKKGEFAAEELGKLPVPENPMESAA